MKGSKPCAIKKYANQAVRWVMLKVVPNKLQTKHLREMDTS